MTTIGDLTREHIGRPVYGIDGIQGWERNLVLRDVEHANGETRLDFRWNDDPHPANTRRGQFAVAVTRSSDTPCSFDQPPTPARRAGEEAGEVGDE